VTDDDGATGSVSHDVLVANTAPAAAFTSSCSALACSFDGGGSSDTDGSIASYTWSFGDGSAPAAGSTTQHSYAQGGSYTVTLTVTDDGGSTASMSTALTVEPPNVAPAALFTSSCAGVTCSVDAGASTDGDGTVVAYSWSFGDGATGTGRTAQHAYAGAGTYAVTLTVTDDDGATATVSRSAVVVVLAASKGKGLQVDLSWAGASTGIDVYRNGTKIATVQGTSYRDGPGKGSFTYKVCAPSAFACSNAVTVLV
jgi:PKD repeat protein